jgi:DNA replication protein DnaC
MHSKTAPCQECLDHFSYEPVSINGKVVFTPQYCDHCVERLINEEARNYFKKKTESRVSCLMRSVPPLYYETDKNRLPFDAVVTMDSWEFNPRGIGLVGKSGAGKSRLGIILLQRIAGQGKLCFFLPATLYANACADQFSDDHQVKHKAEITLNMAHDASVLMIDDLGKNRMTERAESSLYELLEYRTSHMRPTIWTSNSNGTQLHKMFSPDRASAILRRLTEFSDIYTF